MKSEKSSKVFYMTHIYLVNILLHVEKKERHNFVLNNKNVKSYYFFTLNLLFVIYVVKLEIFQKPVQ